MVGYTSVHRTGTSAPWRLVRRPLSGATVKAQQLPTGAPETEDTKDQAGGRTRARPERRAALGATETGTGR